MNYLWKKIEEKSWSISKKRTVYLLETTVLAAVIGLLVWLCIGEWMLPETDWLICFIGYPGFAGFVAGIVKIYKAESFVRKPFGK